MKKRIRKPKLYFSGRGSITFLAEAKTALRTAGYDRKQLAEFSKEAGDGFDYYRLLSAVLQHCELL